ncbi:hypothetical protein AURDEDRAFT_166310 [Auricularia subglabra TFB-10046 SS5]|uniref:C2H2-type domain-containing protein n=1 Tax=Auricularia subglabra (strain TFB-10046 / SS5) TaxID=717982 RepID=J0WZ05_AURST|nr:hypothetical protein AURDEDRAFT_166310 [Auricularia subglabra TFB-10046 SS5]
MCGEDDAPCCLWRKCHDAGPFRSDKDLYEHLIDAHSEYDHDIGFRCRWDGCGRRYAAPAKYPRHIRRHLNLPAVQMPAARLRGCGAVFSRKDHLKKHGGTHSDMEHRESEEEGEEEEGEEIGRETYTQEVAYKGW